MIFNYSGQVSGLGRKIIFDAEIEEGQFNNLIELHGFGRKIYSDGQYYIGNWKNG